MKVLAIDPGNTRSAWLLYDSMRCKPLAFGLENNPILLTRIKKNEFPDAELAIEMIASYGMAVGAEVFETCVWIGRFLQEATRYQKRIAFVYRKDVKLHLCGRMRAKDGNVRQALLDKFGPPGTKKAPGVTYGISKDVWSALAIAVTYAETRSDR